MLGFDLRAAKVAWTVFLLALVIATAYRIRETLAVFVLALFFAYLISPLVDFLQSRLPLRVSRTLVLLVVYLLFLCAVVAIGVSIGGRISEEASSLSNRIPSFFQNPDWMRRIPLPAWLEPMRDRIIAAMQNEIGAGGRDWVPYLTSAGTKVVASLGSVFFVVLVPILAFFFLKDGEQMREGIMSGFVNARQRALLDDILTDVHTLLGQYIRALVILSFGTFVVYFLFLSITGAGFAILLSGVAAVLELIPVVGPITAGIIIFAVSGFTGYTHLLGFAIFWVCYRMFQDYVLSPYLMSSGVEVHPLLVLFGVLAGEQIAGVPGMFFSVPVIATLRVIYVQGARARQRRTLEPVEVRNQ